MKTTARFLALAALFVSVSVTALRAGHALEDVRRAQAILGPEVWSRVIRIENTGRTVRYPRQVHALVFELGGLLWFYTGIDGTQSFSLHRGRLAEEKADFGPLLRDIEPGFARWTVVAGGAPAPFTGAALPNGCFIESVVALRDRLLRGGEAVRPRLLSYYVETHSGRKGHTVLAYETGDRVEVVDSAQAGERFTFPASLAGDALSLARAVLGKAVAAARLLPVDWPSARVSYSSTMAAASATTANSG